MARLRLQGIEKSYDKVRAVCGIDLDIADGEFAVLVGPSGCGKSTLLRCIAGLEEVDTGTVTIGDEGGERHATPRPQPRHGVSRTTRSTPT